MSGKMIIHTTNMLKHHHQKSFKESVGEVLLGVEATLSHGEFTRTEKEGVTYITDPKSRNDDKVDKEAQTLAAKLFLNKKIRPELVKESTVTLLQLLERTQIDSLVISTSGTLENETSREDLSEEFVQAFLPVWREMETLVKTNVVRAIGASDLNAVQLEQLWPQLEIKPSINQVNIDDCCAIPKDLVMFAKSHQVELITHSDHPEIVTEEALNEQLQKHSFIPSSGKFHVAWVIRYSTLLKNRGIVHDKAFVVALFQI